MDDAPKEQFSDAKQLVRKFDRPQVPSPLSAVYACFSRRLDITESNGSTIRPYLSRESSIAGLCPLIPCSSMSTKKETGVYHKSSSRMCTICLNQTLPVLLLPDRSDEHPPPLLPVTTTFALREHYLCTLCLDELLSVFPLKPRLFAARETRGKALQMLAKERRHDSSLAVASNTATRFSN